MRSAAGALDSGQRPFRRSTRWRACGTGSTGTGRPTAERPWKTGSTPCWNRHPDGTGTLRLPQAVAERCRVSCAGDAGGWCKGCEASVDVGPSRMVGAAGLARCGASARPCRPGSIRSSASMRPSRQTRGLAGRCLCWSTARWVPRNAADALGTRPVSFGAIYKARCVDAGPIRRIDHPAEPPRASSRRCGKRHFSPVFNDVTDMAGVMASGSMRGAGRWR